ncbi:DUF5675 family protein [Prevotella sp. HUN102]|uniref:DUF5675 family protein n=1 Tax=Prevotella sp. HUN102 TaxID=1392486 RepID=UPI0004914598|nr:DUF5675 family protein [Prevotella sp. HUN102]
MELRVKRIARRDTYTVGRLYVDGKRFCDTLEDTDRGLSSLMTEAEVRNVKKKGITAIPTGRYRVIYTFSPMFRRRMPLLCGVKGFEAIRIHPGNTARDTEGCILVGRNAKVGMLTESRTEFERLDALMRDAEARNEGIYIMVE